jgi:hypothetical protein
MGTRCLEMVCDEHGIGGSGENCGKNDAHLDHIFRVLPRGLRRQVRTLRGAFRPRVRRERCNPKTPLGELLSPRNLVNHTRGHNWM